MKNEYGMKRHHSFHSWVWPGPDEEKGLFKYDGNFDGPKYLPYMFDRESEVVIQWDLGIAAKLYSVEGIQR